MLAARFRFSASLSSFRLSCFRDSCRSLRQLAELSPGRLEFRPEQVLLGEQTYRHVGVALDGFFEVALKAALGLWVLLDLAAQWHSLAIQVQELPCDVMQLRCGRGSRGPE